MLVHVTTATRIHRFVAGLVSALVLLPAASGALASGSRRAPDRPPPAHLATTRRAGRVRRRRGYAIRRACTRRLRESRTWKRIRGQTPRRPPLRAPCARGPPAHRATRT
jgi:hypothetical protein